jgi:hypothetical protein
VPLQGSLVHPEYGCTQHVEMSAGDLWLLEERDIDAELVRVIAVYSPYEDYGAEVHALAPDAIDLQDASEAGVSDDLINKDTQIGYVFANTVYKLPTEIAPECGRLLLTHTLSPRHLN